MIKNVFRYSMLMSVIIALLGCDPLTMSSVINDTDSDLLLILHYDKELIQGDGYDDDFYVPFFRDFYITNTIEQVDFDSVNLASTFRLPVADTFIIHGSIGTKPEFYFNKMQIINITDTVTIDGLDLILKQFVRYENYFYEFKITNDIFE